MKFVAVTFNNWVAEALGAEMSFGSSHVDISDGETFFWTPGLHAASQYVKGRPYPLTTTLTWPQAFGRQFLSRDIKLCLAADLDRESTILKFTKVADVKDDRYMPQVMSEKELYQQMDDSIFLDAYVIVSDIIEDIADEWRVVILDGKVLDSSRYRTDQLYFDMGIPEASKPEYRDVEKFAGEAAATAVGMPRSYMLDIGTTTSGEMFVIEANPIWCSNWYGNDVELFKLALTAEFTDDTSQMWVPDALMLRTVRMHSILR